MDITNDQETNNDLKTLCEMNLDRYDFLVKNTDLLDTKAWQIFAISSGIFSGSVAVFSVIFTEQSFLQQLQKLPDFVLPVVGITWVLLFAIQFLLLIACVRPRNIAIPMGVDNYDTLIKSYKGKVYFQLLVDLLGTSKNKGVISLVGEVSRAKAKFVFAGMVCMGIVVIVISSSALAIFSYLIG